MQLLELCDLSHWNKDNVFEKVVVNDNRIILKATQGISYVDETLYKRILISMGKCKFIGIYHYLDKKYDGDKQAEHFYKVYKTLSRIAIKCNIRLVPILDFEEGDIHQYNSFYTKWYHFCNTSLVTYTSYSWLKNLPINNNNRLLWIAGWTFNTDKILQRIEEYPTCILYQYTNKYDIDNTLNDRNYFIENRFNNLFFYDESVNL